MNLELALPGIRGKGQEPKEQEQEGNEPCKVWEKDELLFY
jgi:hypothetical protein